MAQVRRVFASFTDPSVKSNLQEGSLKRVSQALKKARNVNSFAVSEDAADFLETQGILTDPFAVDLHSHAADKALENRTLELAGGRMRNLGSGPYTFFQMKRAKLNLFHRSDKDKDQFINWAFEARDLTRFEAPVPFGDVKDIPVLHTVGFMSDTLHFLTPLEVAKLFRHNTHLNHLLATTVLPVEAEYRMPSLHPEVYTIEYFKDGFAYYPGSHAGSGYTHKSETLQWLHINRIEYGELTLIVDKIETLGAHHLMHITRFKVVAPTRYLFATSEYATVPTLFYPDAGQPTKPYKIEFLSRMLMYTKSVKTVSLRDIFAKMRQIIPSHELARYDMSDIICLANYFLYAAALQPVNDYEKVMGLSVWGKVAAYVRTALRPIAEGIFGESEYRQLLKLTHWVPFSFTIEPHGVAYGELLEDTLDWIRPPAAFPPRGAVSVRDWLEDSSLDETLCDTTPETSVDEPTADTERPEQAILDAYAPAHLTDDDIQILNACGFYDLTPQRGADGQFIPPITRNPEPRDDVDVDYPPLDRVLREMIALDRFPKRYVVDRQRAGAYSSDCKNQRVGALTKRQPMEWLKSFATRCEVSEFATGLIVVHGTGGSGKSRAVQEALNGCPTAAEHATIVCPTGELREDWVAKLTLVPAQQIKTYEKALLQPTNACVVFDDYGKLPTGFIDAFLVMHQQTELVILTGDARQSVYHCNNPEAMIRHLPDNVKHFQTYCDYYLNATHRLPRNFANWLNIHASRSDRGYVNNAPKAPTGEPILVPATISRDTLVDLGNRAFTYSGCQGLTRDRISIMLDRNTPSCSDQVMFTALTRATTSITFVNTFSESAEFQGKLECTPYLKAFLSGVWEDESAGREEAPEPEEPAPVDAPKTHIPVENETTLLEPFVEAQGAKEDREVFVPGTGYTNAIQTENEIVQLMPHQQANDDALMQETMKKRLAISTIEENQRQLMETSVVGDLLFEAYHAAMGLPEEPIPFRQDLWNNCAAEVERTYLSKPVANLQNGELRQSPDYDKRAISLFLKSQWVKKEEKLGKPVKAGQTIAAFMQEVVMLYGTAARYMRRIRDEFQPKNTFIMCEKSPDQLNAFILEHWDQIALAYTSDYTMYDQSQDGAFLNFELRKMRFHNLPKEIIEGYRKIKCSAKVFMGVLVIMRLSGEGPTFDANTECNIAYDNLRFDIPKESARLYAGDDLARDRAAPERPTWAKLQPFFTLVAKPMLTAKPDFCSWRITKYGVVQSPLKLYASLKVGLELGRVRDLIPSYSLSFMHAYKLGDALYDIFDEDDMRYHQAVVRIMHEMGVHPKVAGDHFPAYYIRSDHLLDCTHTNETKAQKFKLENEAKIKAHSWFQEIVKTKKVSGDLWRQYRDLL